MKHASMWNHPEAFKVSSGGNLKNPRVIGHHAAKFGPMCVVFGFALSTLGTPVHAVEYRSMDGSGNHAENPTWGQAGIELIRITANAYEDGQSMPRGGMEDDLPNPRSISNSVFDQMESVPNAHGVTDWFWQWGQFLDHDLDLTPSGTPAEPFSVHVPMGDSYFDPAHTGNVIIPLNRSRSTYPDDTREQINEITAFIDASQIYGSDDVRADALRAPGGKLTTAVADNGELLPMYNTPGLPNDGGPSSQLFLSGDIRANEQVGLLATHALFVREHNRIAENLSQRLADGDAELVARRDLAITEVANDVTNQDDFIYQSARCLVGAFIQKITYEEFVPALLGSTLEASSAYDGSMNPSISNEFSTAAFRFGHSMLSPELRRVLPNRRVAPEGNIALGDAFFNPSEAQLHGVDSLLMGLTTNAAQEVDLRLVNDVRNFLFGPPGSGGADLASLNIQRGRDHGLASYVDVVHQLGLANIESFADLREGRMSDDTVDALQSVYTSVDEIDLWVGGLAEEHVAEGMVGETFAAILSDQFTRTQSGDRFYYRHAIHDLTLLDPDFESTRLSDILIRNTKIESIQENVFYVPDPLSLPDCDVNTDGVCDTGDIDAMTELVLEGSSSHLDRIALVENPSPEGFFTYLGDSDLDGVFNEQDFVIAFIRGKYLQDEPADWYSGDWNGDKRFDEQDFLAAFIRGGYRTGPRQLAAAVPEPSAMVLVSLAIVGWICTARVNRRRTPK